MLLVIDRRDSSLEIEGNSLLIRIDGQRQSPVPLGLLTHLIIARKTTLSSSVLTRLANQKTMVTILGGRQQQATAAVIGLEDTRAHTRRSQYAASLNPELSTKICRVLIAAKTRRQVRLLRQITEARPDKRHPLIKATQQIINSHSAIRNADSIATLRGIEGANAAAHFKALSHIFAPRLGFHQRNRRPPTDPVNALLSLTYTLIHHTAIRSAQQNGLDPLCGYLHEALHGRDSLAADLTELLRPAAEELVWRMLRTEVLNPEHFRHQDGACLLGKAGRSIYYGVVSAHKSSWEKQLNHQCKKLRKQLERTP